MVSDIKYQVYYSTLSSGPWTLVNSELIDHSPDGNSINIPDLQQNVNYYILIVGGVIEGSEFVPLISQSIGPQKLGAMGIDKNSVIPLQVKYKIPKRTTYGILGHTFTVV